MVELYIQHINTQTKIYFTSAHLVFTIVGVNAEIRVVGETTAGKTVVDRGAVAARSGCR
jgi:hypothetical protein